MSEASYGPSCTLPTGSSLLATALMHLRFVSISSILISRFDLTMDWQRPQFLRFCVLYPKSGQGPSIIRLQNDSHCVQLREQPKRPQHRD